MKPCLGLRWRLSVEGNRAYVERKTDGVRVAGLCAHEAVALGLMDGRRTDDRIRQLMDEIAYQDGVAALRQVRTRLAPLLVDGGQARESPSLELLASVEAPEPAEGLRPLPGPRVLHWWVTDVCPRRCQYCFADPKHGSKAADAILARARLDAMFAEAATLGTTGLLVAGGEPFLRQDLPEVLGDAVRHGLNPGVTTKHPIDERLARRLAKSGISHICLSVDSFSKADNLLLLGAPKYGSQVRKSALNLRAVGIAFSFECVVTKLNPGAVEQVVAEAELLGARVVQVVPYEPVLRPIGAYTNEDLALPPDYPLDAMLDALGSRYTGVAIERFERFGEGSRSGANCDIGLTKLLFTSAGKVHRCYKFITDAALLGADLTQVSIAEAWHDPRLQPLLSPPRSAYWGSACHTCAHFERCHDDGRCIYQSYVDHGRHFAQDRHCDGPYQSA